MESESESAKIIDCFWNLLNKALTEFCLKETLLNPFGLMSDEAGAFWKAAVQNFHPEVVANSVSCEFHFKENVNRHSRSLGDDNSKERFKKLAFQWLESTTPNGYQSTLGILQNFCQTTTAKKNLQHFVDWWDQRRWHWSRAYKTTLYAPRTNQAEVVNASYVHKGSVNLTLLRAAHEDVAESIMTQTLWEKYQEGSATSGAGPSFEEKRHLSNRVQKNEAVQMVVELEQLQNNAGKKINPPFDFECRHRPDTEKERKKKGRPRKTHVSAYANTDSSAADDDDDKRPEKYREKRSKTFKSTLTRALDREKMKVQTIDTDVEVVLVKLKTKKTYQVTKDKKHIFWSNYLCSIGTIPTCDCPFFISHKGNELCKHIVWTLLNIFNCPVTSRILHQRGYSKSEWRMLKSTMVKNIPSSIKYTNVNSDHHNNPVAEQRHGVENDLNNVFRKHANNTNQDWVISRFQKQKGRPPKCKKCGNVILVGQMHVLVKGLFIPEGQKFATDCKFRFCPDRKCLNYTPQRSNLGKCEEIRLDPDVQLSDIELAIVMSTGLYNEQ